MSNFVASNGVELNEYGHLIIPLGCGSEAVHEARKEFYQHLRDKELGRWRDPEAPNFVVYTSTPSNPNRITVTDEITGHSELYFRDRTDTSDYGDTARRYFAAHPEPKPCWHSATEGDLWEVEHMGFITSIAMVSDKSEFVFTDKSSVPITDENITDAKRLWPEQSDG